MFFNRHTNKDKGKTTALPTSTSQLFKSGDITSIESFGNMRFRVGHIARGGMGLVYQLIPFDNRFSLKAAKVLLSECNQDHFKKEAEIWFNLGEHKNIARPIWYGIWNEKCCILMDWYEGPLNSLNPSKMNSADIARLIIGILNGLNHAFQYFKLIHQDIKPSNILIDPEENPRLADFGLALLGVPISNNIKCSIDKSLNQTITLGEIGGTPIYMAPELFVNNAKSSITTDIYSLGVTLFEWLTQEHPYLGPETSFQFSPKLRIKRLKKIKKHLGSSSLKIIAVLKRCLDLNPANRPSSYQEILDTLTEKTSVVPLSKEMNPKEIVKLVTLHRAHRKYEKAEQLLNKALKLYPEDPLLFNTFARLRLFQNRLNDAHDLFQKGFGFLCRSNGIYDGKPYLDPAMNLAKLYIISSEYEIADEILAKCWKWADEGNNESFLYYEEFGWYLLNRCNPENAGDILLHISRSRKLGNHAMRWFTLSIFFADAIQLLAPQLAKYWLEVENRLEASDAVAMSLCALYSPSSMKSAIYNRIDKDFAETFASASKEHNLKPNWYKLNEYDNAKMLAAILDLSITGGAFADSYKLLFLDRQE